MLKIGMHEAKTRLSELVKMVDAGEDVYLTNRGKVVAKIVKSKNDRKKKAQNILKKLDKLVKEYPLGSYEELMSWRHQGLR